MKKWLDSAFLGTESASLGAHACGVLDPITEWICRWVGSDGVVGLVENTTVAADVVLKALLPQADVIVYSETLHPTMRKSLDDALAFFSRLGKQVEARGIAMLDVERGDAGVFAEALSLRIKHAVGNRRAILLLDHVSYRDGLLLPLEAIGKRLSALKVDVRLIIDGAQAVGLWRPSGAIVSAYVGCFHKFVGAPPGTGFFWLDPVARSLVPNSVRHRGYDEGYELPTTDLAKWLRVGALLLSAFSEDNVRKHQGLVRKFREVLAPKDSPDTSLGLVDMNLTSHIIGFDLGERASAAWNLLAENGYSTRRFGTTLRVSVSRTTRLRWAHEIKQLLKMRM